MFTQDLLNIIWWWFTLFCLGVIFIPTTLLYFGRFFDGGYAYSKTIAYLSITYLTWLFGSLKVLPFTREALFLLIGIALSINAFLLVKHKEHIKTVIAKKFGVMTFEEVLFFSALTCWALVRGFLPDIRGLEKFMDYGFMNSILTSQYFPPEDMWFSSQHINYYYFGHLISAFLTKLSNVEPGSSYNLMIATLFALSFVSSFSLVGNLIFSKTGKLALAFLSGLIGALLVNLGGNFHTIYIAFKNSLAGSSLFLNYWYPDATRFIVQQFGARDNTIHEFPIYSFVVADLHGHLINLPSVLLFLALLITILIKTQINKLTLLALSFLIGVFYITNSWDLPVYGLLFALVTLYIYWKQYGVNIKTVLVSALIGGAVLAGSFMITLPFHFAFENISQGISLANYRSPIWMLFVLWGGPFLITLLFLVFLFSKKNRLIKNFATEDFFILAMLAVSWTLIAIPEVIYVKDIYIDRYQRANTMFKFTYQSFVMFSLSSAYILIRVLVARLETLCKSLFKLMALLPVSMYVFVMMIYPFFAIKTFYTLKTYQSLNGEYWLFREYPGEYKTLEWIRKNVNKKSVVLSAPGDSYSDYGVIQSYSGMPTVQGWFVHEWLWRGGPDEPTKRVGDVEIIYTSEDLATTRELLHKYKVQYVVVGKLERDKYINLRPDKFLTLGKIVFRSEGASIYRIN